MRDFLYGRMQREVLEYVPSGCAPVSSATKLRTWFVALCTVHQRSSRMRRYHSKLNADYSKIIADVGPSRPTGALSLKENLRQV